MKYLYENHMGGIYTSDAILDDDYLYCETCGDWDHFIGPFNTVNEFWSLIEKDCDIYGSGGYCMEYIYPIIVREFDLPDKIEYQDDYDECSGFCCNDYDSIINRIEELIGRKVERRQNDAKRY